MFKMTKKEITEGLRDARAKAYSDWQEKRLEGKMAKAKEERLELANEIHAETPKLANKLEKIRKTLNPGDVARAEILISAETLKDRNSSHTPVKKRYISTNTGPMINQEVTALGESKMHLPEALLNKAKLILEWTPPPRNTRLTPPPRPVDTPARRGLPDTAAAFQGGYKEALRVEQEKVAKTKLVHLHREGAAPEIHPDLDTAKEAANRYAEEAKKKGTRFGKTWFEDPVSGKRIDSSFLERANLLESIIESYYTDFYTPSLNLGWGIQPINPDVTMPPRSPNYRLQAIMACAAGAGASI